MGPFSRKPKHPPCQKCGGRVFVADTLWLCEYCGLKGIMVCDRFIFEGMASPHPAGPTDNVLAQLIDLAPGIDAASRDPATADAFGRIARRLSSRVHTNDYRCDDPFALEALAGFTLRATDGERTLGTYLLNAALGGWLWREEERRLGTSAPPIAQEIAAEALNGASLRVASEDAFDLSAPCPPEHASAFRHAAALVQLGRLLLPSLQNAIGAAYLATFFRHGVGAYDVRHPVSAAEIALHAAGIGERGEDALGRFCGACGGERRDDSDRFCSSCGAAFR